MGCGAFPDLLGFNREATASQSVIGYDVKFFPAALACAAFVTMVPAAHAQDASCTVETLRGGEARVLRAGLAEPMPEGMALRGDDRIETGAGAIVAVACRAGIRLTVGPDTSLDLREAGMESEGWVAFLLKGIAGFARPIFGGERFEVRTPSAVASVRSTEWIVIVEEDATAVFVEEGAVAVAARTGGAVLRPDEGIDVTPDGMAGPVKTWGPARVRAMLDRLGRMPE